MSGLVEYVLEWRGGFREFKYKTNIPSSAQVRTPVLLLLEVLYEYIPFLCIYLTIPGQSISRTISLGAKEV